jgi:alpha-N-arabinofuranosidase
MVKRDLVYVAVAVAVISVVGMGIAAAVELSVSRDVVVNRIDEKVYGHFLEHIYHSVNGGLWGEMIWDRSFEGGAVAGSRWSIENDCLVQDGLAENVRLVFGDPNWTDYEFSLEAQKTGGQEGFLILFRAASEKEFYWANLGGWSNVRHSLERGVKGQSRWGPVGPSVPGKIEQGKWYRIRIRCEGRHIQVWLGDDKLIDFTDDVRASLSGRVGVGTWNTEARYRNLRVTSLDGTKLFEGLPEVKQPSALPHTWQAYGQGKTRLTSEGALNCDSCELIVSEGGETGVQQSPLCVRDGETYYGSVWVRGDAPEGLVVRLLDAEKTLAEKSLGRPNKDWREYSFEVKPVATAANATIQLGVRGKGKVYVDQVSLMSKSARETGGFRPDLLKAIAELKPPIIRWPGGCFASAYRWKAGIGPQHKRVKYPRLIWDDVDVNSFGTDEFVAMCRKVGAEPLIVVNIGTRQWNGEVEREAFLQEVCDWIEYCNGPADSKWGRIRAANGHPEPYNVKYWEIDNETWQMGAEAYAEAVRMFAPAMTKVDPSIRLAACGSGGYGRGASDWNGVIVERCADLINFLSIHHYESPDNYAQGPGLYERFFRRTGSLISESKNLDLKVYVSEWNAQSTDWRTGLYCGGLLNAFERCGDIVEIGGPALFLRHVSARSWDNAFINFDHRTWFPAPNYVVMKLWRKHYAPDRVQLDGDTGPLNAVVAKSADGKRLYLKIVNPSEEPVPVRLTLKQGFRVDKASMQIVSPDSLSARNTLDEPNKIRPVSHDVRTEKQSIAFTMPRWSAGVVTIVSQQPE